MNLKYVRDKFIGEGREARVYMCHHVDNEKQKYVMKRVSKNNKDGCDGITNEIKILSLIQHPNIIKLIDHFEDSEYLYEILEYMDSDLFEVIDNLDRRHSKLSLNEVKHYSRSIFEALKFCHANGIMHRDVKPENICVKGKMIKLIDFGFATHAPFANDKYGTTDFIAPEIDYGKMYNNSVDVWAAGVCVYEMLTFETPFDVKKRDYKLHLSNKIPRDAREFLRLIFNMDYTKRATCEELLNHPFLLQ